MQQDTISPSLTQSRAPREEYAGATRLETALGKGKKWGFAGGVIGEVVGAIAGASFIKADSPLAARAQALTEGMPFIGKKVSGRTALILGSALATGMVGHKIGFYLTSLNSWKDADAGKEQFERLVAERNAALLRSEKAEEALQQVAVAAVRFSDKQVSRTALGSHAAAHEAEAATETEITR